jgi:hypothetical protein
MGMTKEQEGIWRHALYKVAAFVSTPLLGVSLGYILGAVLAARRSGQFIFWPAIGLLVLYAVLATGVVTGVVLALMALWEAIRAQDRRLGALVLLVLWPWALVHRLRHSARLAEWLVAWAVACLPGPYRAQYEAVWLGEVDWHKQ